MIELLDRRILGAIRCQDGITGLVLQHPLKIESDSLVLKRNRQGDYVIVDILNNNDLHVHTTVFADAPSTPGLESVPIDVVIRDPLGDYLPQRHHVRLPRDRNLQSAVAIVKPIPIPLFRSPRANTEPNWAVIRATLADQTTGQRLPWALVKVVKIVGDEVTTLALAMADWRGEALIAVPGIPVMTWNAGGGAVLTREVDVRIDIVFDPQVQSLSLADLSLDPNRNYLPNPEVLASNSPTLRRGSRNGYKLAAGRDRPDVIAVVLS
jgi:hypothetical protein